jgi:hypothetical protein
MPRSSKRMTKIPPPPAGKKNLPVKQTPGLGSTILGNIFTGMTFGAGSSMGHRAVDAVLGSKNQESKDSQINNQETTFLPCERLFDMYENCLKNEKNDCNYLFDMIRLKCNFN